EDTLRVKILVLGDSGVGKSSLVHLLTNHSELTNPAWTVGCSLQVGLHEYRSELTGQAERLFFLEFWDIGGYPMHKNSRGVFYHGVHGILLVHDLTNRKTELNLSRWLHESCLGADTPPVLVIGAKSDLCKADALAKRPNGGEAAPRIGCPEILLSCVDTRSLSAGTTNAVKLDRFYDQVIEYRLRPRASTPPRVGQAISRPNRQQSKLLHGE
ncbi:hypothetical protein BOX15_Mlig000840g2, partial [Macrostomum lignano]